MPDGNYKVVKILITNYRINKVHTIKYAYRKRRKRWLNKHYLLYIVVE